MKCDSLKNHLCGLLSISESTVAEDTYEFLNTEIKRTLWEIQLENDLNGNPRTSTFYCDPMRSNQKGGIENVHTMLRMILPKGTVFTNLTRWDVRKCVDHINNAPRKNLD